MTGPVRGFWYTVSGGLFIQQVYGTIFLSQFGYKVSFFPLVFRYSVPRHELIVYFSVEASLLAG